MKVKTLSYEDDFDRVAFRLDRAEFRRWSQSIRSEELDTGFRETDAVVCELAQYSVQRSLARAIPPDYKWRVEYDSERAFVVVTTPSGVEQRFTDQSLGVLIYRMESTNWESIVPSEPLPEPVQPLRFAEVDYEDPFEKARAELLLRRIQEEVAS